MAIIIIHSTHEASSIKKSCSSSGRYDYQSVLSFHLNQQNSRSFLLRQFPIGELALLVSVFRKGPEACQAMLINILHPIHSPIAHESKWEAHNEESQS